jgi:hypothetical protein
MLTMTRLRRDKRAQVLRLFCERNSMRAISRIVDVAFNGVKKLLIAQGPGPSCPP